MNPASLGWLGIIRLGLVQTALGAIVVLTTSALNRVMVVELALPATLPGLLVGLHYALQMLRPRMGYGSDMGGRRTPWIIGGMAVLALGGVLAAAGTALMAEALWAGIALAVLAFLLIGAGVGAAGTSLLVLLASRTAPARRAAAASLVWIMMIAGFVITTAIAGRLLDPYSPMRLVAVAGGVSAIAFTLATLTVLARSKAEMPVEIPSRASMETVKAVL